MRYEHTQVSPARWVAPVVLALGFVITALVTQESVVLVPTAAFVVVIGAIFLTSSRLTVAVSADGVRAAFGVGWPRRTIPLDRITSAEVVRNRWYHGWGIRLVAKGFMFNIWGYDAVELHLTSGRRFRIGTDEPGELEAAVTSALAAR